MWLYFSTIAFQWVVALFVAWRAWSRGLSAEDLGLVVHNRLQVLLAVVIGGVVISTLHWLNMRRVGKLAKESRGILQQLAERILPQSNVELVPYLGLAVTAGVCEEFLYRGFVMGVLTRTGLSLWLVVILSSVLFGLAHLYQGPGGFIGTLLLGTVFAGARIAYDTVIVVMVWHAAVDVVAGIAGPRYLVRQDVFASETQI